MVKFVLTLYRDARDGLWKFDDERYGLRAEPLVDSATKLIDKLLKTARCNLCTVLVSNERVSKRQTRFEWLCATEPTGNVYVLPATGESGWLCPALFHYFDQAPQALFVYARAK
jgi:hypothetical protein